MLFCYWWSLEMDKKTNSNENNLLNHKPSVQCVRTGASGLWKEVWLTQSATLLFEFDSFKRYLIQTRDLTLREGCLSYSGSREPSIVGQTVTLLTACGQQVGCKGWCVVWQTCPGKVSYELGSLLGRWVEWLRACSVDIQARGWALQRRRKVFILRSLHLGEDRG